MPSTMHDREAARETLLDAFDFAQDQVSALLENTLPIITRCTPSAGNSARIANAGRTGAMGFIPA